MKTENSLPSNQPETKEQIVSRRINSIGWALFFVMIGCLWLVPPETLPESTWLIGTGLIMLGANYFRYINGIKTVGFTIIIGILALAAGIANLFGIELPIFPILIVLIGLSIIIGHATEKNHPRE